MPKKDYFMALFNRVFSFRKTIEGHSAGAKKDKLIAYSSFGVTSCHEPITLDEALERLRLGIYVMIREGGVRKDLGQMVGLKDMNIDKRKVILVTDSISPEFLLKQGYFSPGIDNS